MDLSAFSKENYDIKEAVNEIFRSSEAKNNSNDIKQFASSMVMRLQLAIQEVNGGIEETSSQVVMTLPRVLRDTEALSHEADILKNQMLNVKKDIETVEKSTATSMQTLVKLDMVKGRLCASSQALKEADNWTTLSSDIEEVMDTGDLEAISSKLISLQNCLTILTHVPDYEDRVAHLEGLKVRLEALLSPHLVSAFTQHNLDDSTKYAKMLKTLGRSKNLEGYYHKCEQQQLQTAWRVNVEGNIMSGPPTWLSSFFNTLSSLITKQIKWCELVFEDSDSRSLLAELTRSVLAELDPSLSHVVTVAMKQQEEPMTFLSSVKSYVDSFIQDYQAVTKTSSNDSELFEVNREIFRLIYLPIRDQMKNYQDLEESFMLSHLVSSDIVREDLSESLQNLRDYCSSMNAQIDVSSKRCLNLSGGICFPSLVRSVATYVENFNEKLAQVARHVEQQTTSIEDDWTVFNTCLALIQAAGELLIVVDTMEHSLATVLTNSASKIQWEAVGDPFLLTPDVILTPKENEELQTLIKAVIDDDERMLQSCLNLAQDQCEKSVEVALNTMMGPVTSQLGLVPSLPSWSSSQGSLLSVAFSPQEYVTQIGQYLMTLPQHLEPLLVTHTPALNRALHENSLRSSSDCRIVSESDISAADFLIGSVSQSTCRQYTDLILKIPEIVPNMVTQLTTDIDYICNIFEDLGVISCDPLDKLNILLKTPADQYWTVAPGNPPRIVAAVRQIRDIPAKS